MLTVTSLQLYRTNMSDAVLLIRDAKLFLTLALFLELTCIKANAQRANLLSEPTTHTHTHRRTYINPVNVHVCRLTETCLEVPVFHTTARSHG